MIILIVLAMLLCYMHHAYHSWFWLHVQVRSNIMVALVDLCMHRTALVDPHVPRLAACIADPHPLLRRQALAFLSHLLLKVGTTPLPFVPSIL